MKIMVMSTGIKDIGIDEHTNQEFTVERLHYKVVLTKKEIATLITDNYFVKGNMEVCLAEAE